MTKLIASNGDLVYITTANKIIELYIDNNEPMGFKVQMIFNEMDYEKMYKQSSKMMKTQAKKITDMLKTWD